MENRVKLDDLDASAQNVRQSVTLVYKAFQFENGATRLKNRYQWEQYRTILMVGGLGLVNLVQLAFLSGFMEIALNDCYCLICTEAIFSNFCLMFIVYLVRFATLH